MYHLYSYSYVRLIYTVTTPEAGPGGRPQASAGKVVLSARLTLSTSLYQCNVSVIPIYHYMNLPAADFSVTGFISLIPTQWFPSPGGAFDF